MRAMMVVRRWVTGEHPGVLRHGIRSGSGLCLLAASTFLGACAAAGGADRAARCPSGSPCEVRGTLSVSRGEPVSVVIVDRGTTCAKLALPEPLLRDLNAWDGKSVVVSGIAFDQFVDPALAMTWFSDRDRKLGVGVCDDGDGIHVESIGLD